MIDLKEVLTVGDLRKALEGLADDTPVAKSAYGDMGFDFSLLTDAPRTRLAIGWEKVSGTGLSKPDRTKESFNYGKPSKPFKVLVIK